MPVRHLDAANLSYYLVILDKEGRELPEDDGTLLSAQLGELVKDGVTDVFFCSHGWMGDVPAAIRQYDAWITMMAKQSADRALARRLVPNFKSLVIGIHWPSLPWGDERVEAAVLGEPDDELAHEDEISAQELIDRYAERIADTPSARAALQTIVAAAGDRVVAEQIAAGTVPVELDSVYQTLFTEAGLGIDGVAGAPGSDQQTFAPAQTAREWATAVNQAGAVPGAGGPGVLGVFGRTRDVVLGPVRQMSFWAMKHRARNIGERDVHRLLRTLQGASTARFHLMGHSFGCIVVTAATAGPVSGGQITDPLPRSIDSLVLAQGAMSLWSFADAIPFPPSGPGYFHALCRQPRVVQGPIVTTTSSHDRAVGVFFPLGARLGHDRTLGANDLPEYGGLGSYGAQGTMPAEKLAILNADAPYRFIAGTAYNIDASRIIATGGGFSGAHSDIVHDEVAHIFWQAALSGMSS